MFNKQIVQHQDRLYILVTTAAVKQGQDRELMKQFVYCDTVLESEQRLYFCRSISEPEYTVQIESNLPVLYQTN